MKKSYPVIFTEVDNGWFVIYVPDFEANTQGKGLADAKFMAYDIIGFSGIFMQDENQTIPEPSSFETVQAQVKNDEFVLMIDVDFVAYRVMHNKWAFRQKFYPWTWVKFIVRKIQEKRKNRQQKCQANILKQGVTIIE